MEGPHQLARAEVPRANVHVGSAGLPFLPGRARDDQVAEDRARRRHPIGGLGESIGHADRRSMAPLVPKAGNELPGLRIEGDQPAVARAGQDARRVLCVAGPVGHASRGRAGAAEIVLPDLPARVGLERDDGPSRRRRVHDAVDDDRHRFGGRQHLGRGVETGGGGIDPVLPGELQLRHVLGVDLRQARESLPALIVGVGRPVALTPLAKQPGPDDCRTEDGAECQLRRVSTHHRNAIRSFHSSTCFP